MRARKNGAWVSESIEFFVYYQPYDNYVVSDVNVDHCFMDTEITGLPENEPVTVSQG